MEFERFQKLSRDSEKNTIIYAGEYSFTIEQLEDDIINPKTEIGRKLLSIEKYLDYY